MENKTKNTTVSYRNKHIIIIASVVCIVIAEIFALSGIWKALVYAGYAFVVGALTGAYEGKDELTQQTLAKATEITFFVLLAVLFIAALVAENVHSVLFAVEMYYYILFGAIALRSIIFLWLDRTPKEEDDEESEDE